MTCTVMEHARSVLHLFLSCVALENKTRNSERNSKQRTVTASIFALVWGKVIFSHAHLGRGVSASGFGGVSASGPRGKSASGSTGVSTSVSRGESASGSGHTPPWADTPCQLHAGIHPLPNACWDTPPPPVNRMTDKQV